jgi:MFS family permease
MAAAWRSWPHNVRLNFAFNAVSAFAQSIIQGQIYSNFVFSLDGNSNDDVGYVSAVSGVVMALLALPIGWMLDRWPRHAMLRAACCVGVVASALMFWALVAESMQLLYATAALFGAFNAMSNPALASIFADSVESGRRTRVYAITYAVQLGCMAAGPAIAVVFFWRLGNTWETGVMRTVMLAGNACSTLSVVLLWFFDDAKSMGSASEALGGKAEVSGDSRRPLLAADKAESNAGGGNSEDATMLIDSPQDSASVSSRRSGAGTESGSPTAPASTRNLGHQRLRLGCVTLTTAAIPYIIFASDMVIATGAGMTVAFFGIYWAADYGLTPVEVSAIYVASPLCVAALTALAVPVSNGHPGGGAATGAQVIMAHRPMFG